MRLTQPTDFEILDALADERRNTAKNLAIQLERKRGYINTRLPVLADYDLVERIGPAENSGLYVITDRGLAALARRSEYAHDVDFEALIADELAAADAA